MAQPREVHHPTIIVGFGEFGRHVLYRLLTTAASRGVLAWQDSAPGAAPSERRLRDLALVHLENPFEKSAPESDLRGVGSFELMSDLYRHVEHVEGAQALAAAIDRAASDLLSMSTRAGNAERLRLGLDVVVVAHPGPNKEIGVLQTLLGPAFDALGTKPNLAPAGPGAERLCFIQILDYEHYWNSAAADREAREALLGAIGHWEDRRAKRQPAFGRIYAVDGQAAGGIRDAAYRVDEIALFLEFLLFEGQRTQLQQLYQRQSDKESPVGAFGIRVFERGAGLLGRLAAARFGVEWLDYLEGSGRAEDHEAIEALRARLAPFAPAAVREHLSSEQLRSEVLKAIDKAVPPIVATDADAAAWVAEVRAGVERAVRDVRDLAALRVSGRAQELVGDGRARAEVRAALEAALHDAPGPVTLGAAIDAVAALHAETTPAPPRADAVEDPLAAGLAEIEAKHLAYKAFSAGQVSPERLRPWWYLLSMVVAAGAGPIIARAIGEIAEPDRADTYAHLAFEVLSVFKAPLYAGLLVLVVSLAACFGVFHPALRARVRRAARFYTDPARGRLADAVRRTFAPGGEARTTIDRGVELALDDAERSIRSEVHREAARALTSLRTRAREVAWLRGQLRELLQLHGLDPGKRAAAEAFRPPPPSVRFSASLARDFEQVLRGNPPNPARFRSAQRAVRPFSGWDGEFSELLLFPLLMLDKLSEDYVDPLERERAQPGSGPEQRARAAEILEFLGANHDLETAFLWAASDGAAAVATQRLCLLPEGWHDLDGVRRRLQEHAYDVAPGGEGRTYLVRLENAVPIDRLRSAR